MGMIRGMILVVAFAATTMATVATVQAQNATGPVLPEGSVDQYRVDAQYGSSEAVLNPRYPHDEKLELSIGGAYSSASSLMSYYALNGALTYHFAQRHAIEPLWFQRSWGKVGSFVTGETPPSKLIKGNPAQIGVEVPQQMWAASYLFSPFYSKMHITQQSVAHFDVYMGPGFGLLQQRPINLDGSQGSLVNRPALSLALGLRFLYGSRWGLRLEMRDFVHQVQNYAAVSVGNTLQIGASADIFFGSFRNGSGSD